MVIGSSLSQRSSAKCCLPTGTRETVCAWNQYVPEPGAVTVYSVAPGLISSVKGLSALRAANAMQSSRGRKDFFIGKKDPDYRSIYSGRILEEVRKDFRTLSPLYRMLRGFADEAVRKGE